MGELKVFFAYSRQSVARSGDHGDSASIADQFRSIEDYAARLGGRVVRRYSDGDTSGATESRDGLDAMLADVKTVKPDAVLIRDVSRLARDTRIFLTLVDTLKRSDVQLLSSTESLEDRTLATVISAISERERLALAGRVAGGVREHARRGKTHGRAAFGFRRLNGEMVIYEPEAAVVRFAFERFAAGDSVTMIVVALNADPSAPRPPETNVWRRDTIAKMLARPTYAGDAVIRARRDISGRLWPAVATKDAHPAIVPRALFDAVQRRFRAPTAIVRQTLVSPLSGLLWCGACGGRLFAINQSRKHRPNDLRIARCANVYQSRREGQTPTCPGARHSMMLPAIEALTFSELERLLTEDLIPVDELLAKMDARMVATANDDSAAKARARLADIERRRSRLLDAYESGALDLMTWQARDRLLGADAAALTETIQAAPDVIDRAGILATRAALADIELGDVDVRALLTELGAKVVINMDTRAVRVEPGPAYRDVFV